LKYFSKTYNSHQARLFKNNMYNIKKTVFLMVVICASFAMSAKLDDCKCKSRVYEHENHVGCEVVETPCRTLLNYQITKRFVWCEYRGKKQINCDCPESAQGAFNQITKSCICGPKDDDDDIICTTNQFCFKQRKPSKFRCANSGNPTANPTKDPTKTPTKTPTKSPTNPTKNPTANPTSDPTTSVPTADPTRNPTESTYCKWIQNNVNTVDEEFVGHASSYGDCIRKVQKLCPSADIASVTIGGKGECWCQYGDNFDKKETDFEICDVSKINSRIAYSKMSFSGMSSEQFKDNQVKITHVIAEYLNQTATTVTLILETTSYLRRRGMSDNLDVIVEVQVTSKKDIKENIEQLESKMASSEFEDNVVTKIESKSLGPVVVKMERYVPPAAYSNEVVFEKNFYDIVDTTTWLKQCTKSLSKKTMRCTSVEPGIETIIYVTIVSLSKNHLDTEMKKIERNGLTLGSGEVLKPVNEDSSVSSLNIAIIIIVVTCLFIN